MTLLAASAIAAFGTWAASLTMGDLSMSGNTLSIPVTVAGGGDVSLYFGSAEPKDGEPVPGAVAVEAKAAADGDTVTFTQTVVLGKKVAYRLVVEGDEKSGTYEVADTARYQWNDSAGGRWSDATKWTFETNPNDGLERLGYPSYGSFFVFKGFANTALTVEIDGVYGQFAESRIGRDNEHMELTLKGVVSGAELKIDSLDNQGTYVGNSLTLDNVTIPNIQKWIVRDNCTLSVTNGAVLKSGWEFRVAKTNAKLYVGPGGTVETSVRESYHRLGLAGDGAEIVIEDGTLVVGNTLQICNSADGTATSPKGITFKGTRPQLQIKSYAKSYQSEGQTAPTLTFLVPADGYERAPIVKAGTESDHSFIDLDNASQKINIVIDDASPFLSRATYGEQTLVDWTYNNASYSVAANNFNVTSDKVFFSPTDQATKNAIVLAVGEKPAVPGVSVVTFDPNGGELEDTIRIVKTGATFGENVNLYTAEITTKGAAITDITGGLMTYSSNGQWCNYWSKPVDHILVGRKYTYVLDVTEYAKTSGDGPEFHIGWTDGDTYQSAQLSSGPTFRPTGAGRYVHVLEGREAETYRVLERAYIYDNGNCDMKFRVQLYAGRNAVPAADVYAAPGEVAAMALPVPTRQGFAFAGWVDASGNPVTAATEVTAMEGQDQTLTATWTRQDGVVMPVKVTFDPNGGQVSEKFRWVNTEQPFGRTLNLYSGTARDKFMDFNDSYLSLQDNLFTYNADGRWCNYWSLPAKDVEPGETYTYVIEVSTFAKTDANPWFNIGHTGDWHPQLPWAAVEVTGTGVFTSTLTARAAENGPFDLLGRDYIDLPSGSCQMTFRVSLFAGSGVTASNYSYAAPGEGMPLALPVPVRAGKVFDCWVDSEGNPVTDETIVEADGDITLTARWKGFVLIVTQADRPQVGQPLTLSTNYGEGEGEDGEVSYRWFRGDWQGVYEDEPISTSASYTPQDADIEHFLKGVVSIDGTLNLETAIWFSKLPVVYIDTEDGKDIAFKADEKSANVRVQGNAEFKQQYDGAAKVKGRGNSTWGLPKKPYKVKLDKKTDMFGFGKNKHWVLLANFIDVSSMRNKLAYDMSGEFGLTYQASTWVEVVFNGRFDGTYQFGEHVRIDSTRVDVFDWEGESEDRGYAEEDLSWVDGDDSIDVTGGYLWELSAEYDEVSKFKIDVDGNGESDGDIPVMFKYPEFAATSDRMMDWASNYWSDVYTSWTSLRNTTADGSKSWKDLCDIDSMISFWLINEIFGNHDAWYKSRYCYKDFDGKLTFGPVWDFDWGLGSVAVGMGDAAKWILARDKNNGWAVSFYKEWLDDPWFCLRAWEKYREMRPKFAALFEGEGCEYDGYAAYLSEAGLVEDARWGAERNAAYGENARTVAKDTEMFKTWMTTRLAWLDTIFETPETLMSAIANHESAHQYFPYTEDRDYWDWHKGTYRPDDIGAAVSGQALAKNDLGLAASAKDETVAVDLIVNGRFIRQVARADFGSVEIAKADWYERGHKTLVELIGYDSEGKMTARSHLIVDPMGIGCWEDVTSETAADEIVPAAQAAQLDTLGVAALKVAGWAIAQKVAFDPEQAINLEAFALNCAPTSAGIAEEKAAFKLSITIDADGTPHVSLPEGKTYNMDPVIEGREALDAGAWHAPYNAADHFFRGIINLP